MRIKLVVAAIAAGLLAAVVAAPAAHASDATPEAIDEYLSRAVAETGAPGLSAVVTHDGEIVHAAGYGHDSRGDAVTEDTPMRVASVTKSFTAAAVMTLVEDGKIDLDEPVAKQLPEFAMADSRASEVTVRQLLNQTSGFSDTTIDVVELEEESTSLADYVSRLSDDGLAADPGAKWEYCNVNFDVAARLVEHVSGTDFNAYMKRHVLGPLGMDGSSMRGGEAKPANGYNSLYGVWTERAEPGFLDDSGAGGLITTAADMGRWLISQQGDGEQLVSAEGLAAMHEPTRARDYGMGWGVEGDRLVHSGNLMTYNAYEVVDTGTGYGVAVMTNGAGLVDPAYSVAQGLLALTEGERPADIESDGTAQLVLAVLALVSLGLGTLGVLRARRWAGKRATRPAWRAWSRLLPALAPIVLFATYPYLLEFLMNGRTVTWAQLTYFAIPITVTLACAALAGAATLATRVLRLRTAR